MPELVSLPVPLDSLEQLADFLSQQLFVLAYPGSSSKYPLYYWPICCVAFEIAGAN